MCDRFLFQWLFFLHIVSSRRIQNGTYVVNACHFCDRFYFDFILWINFSLSLALFLVIVTLCVRAHIPCSYRVIHFIFRLSAVFFGAIKSSWLDKRPSSHNVCAKRKKFHHFSFFVVCFGFVFCLKWHKQSDVHQNQFQTMKIMRETLKQTNDTIIFLVNHVEKYIFSYFIKKKREKKSTFSVGPRNLENVIRSNNERTQ